MFTTRGVIVKRAIAAGARLTLIIASDMLIPMTSKSRLGLSCLLAAIPFLHKAAAESNIPPVPQMDAPAHERPYFMPVSERQRLLNLVRTQEWAAVDYARVKALATKGDGYWAAFLYALEGDAAYLPAARRKLQSQYGEKGSGVVWARNRLATPEFFHGGQPHIAEVYYDLDISGLVAYDWAWQGLTPDERREIEDGMVIVARFKMRCMDRWNQTPNLVIKPTFMVAMTGLVTQDPACLAWGFRRNPGSDIGGYFEVLDVMLRDHGPWHETPFYPIRHKCLFLLAQMSRYRGLYDGVDQFRQKTPGGGSAQGLLDYYVATAYPMERTSQVAGLIRCATYGDGATSAAGDDVFLAKPQETKWSESMAEGLAASFAASGGDPRYAPFVAMIPGYQPALWDAPPLPADRPFPPAPSSIWPTVGLAMLRSDETPGYWTNTSAIAVFALMTQGYGGHAHRDKFAICLHGANRLFYPDCNSSQYENPNVGWTRNTICHNTMIVDEQETRDATPTAVRYAFTPEVKFLAISADRVYESVAQTRALMLTREYLLDLFTARSAVPHTYDYLLHSFGKPKPVAPAAFAASTVLEKRYWLMKSQQTATTDAAWKLDFDWHEGPLAPTNSSRGEAGFDQRAMLRVDMASETNTLVVHGLDAHGVPMLVARRAGRRATTFVATHEPFAAPAAPLVREVRVLAQTSDAMLVRVDAETFTDYAVIAWGSSTNGVVHSLASLDSAAGVAVAFTNYGYLRVTRDGAITARGGWSAFRVPAAKGPVTLNGRPAAARVEQGTICLGPQPIIVAKSAGPDPECPFPVTVAPSEVRLTAGSWDSAGWRDASLTICNTLQEDVAGVVEFQMPSGLRVEPRQVSFGPLAPGQEAKTSVVFTTFGSAAAGRQTIPYRVILRSPGKPEQPTLFLPLSVIVGPTLEWVYRHPATNVYRVCTSAYTAELDMFHGLCRRLADADGVVRLDGTPLFTFGDEQTEMLGAGTKQAFTWTTEVPAHLKAHAYDRCQYHVGFENDRLTVWMDADWTQFATARFTVPGQWKSPKGEARWRRVVNVDATTLEANDPPKAGDLIAAAELAFPDGGRSLAFKFDPPQPVIFQGTSLSFPLNSRTGDRWSVGFCRPGELDSWRQSGYLR